MYRDRTGADAAAARLGDNDENRGHRAGEQGLLQDRRQPFGAVSNPLLAQGQEFSDYHAITGGSAHNYRAIVAGETSVTSGGPNIFRAIGDPNCLSLQESMAGDCGVHTTGVVPGTLVPLCTHGHDPAYVYRSNHACATNDVPLTSDSQLASLPSFTFITPNMCDDMHTFANTGACPAYFGPVSGSNAISIGDAWLSHVVPLLVAPGETVFITFDEGGSPNSSMCTRLRWVSGSLPDPPTAPGMTITVCWRGSIGRSALGLHRMRARRQLLCRSPHRGAPGLDDFSLLRAP